jgi:pentatricopeptide repeat protein
MNARFVSYIQALNAVTLSFQMSTLNVAKNGATYRAVFFAFEQAGQWEDAVDLLRSIEVRSLEM